MKPTMSDNQRGWVIPEFSGICWPLDVGLDKDGYAVLKWSIDARSPSTGRLLQRRRALHLVTYALLRGPIPEGLVADHLCRTRNCINPWHLEFVETKVNVLRGVGTGATYAKRNLAKCGHPFDGEYHIKGKPYRVCLACARAAAKARRSKAS